MAYLCFFYLMQTCATQVSFLLADAPTVSGADSLNGKTGPPGPSSQDASGKTGPPGPSSQDASGKTGTYLYRAY